MESVDDTITSWSKWLKNSANAWTGDSQDESRLGTQMYMNRV